MNEGAATATVNSGKHMKGRKRSFDLCDKHFTPKMTTMFVSRRPLTSRIYESASNRRREKNDHLSNAPTVGCAARTVCDTRSNFSVIAFYFPTLCARTTKHSTCNIQQTNRLLFFFARHFICDVDFIHLFIHG